MNWLLFLIVIGPQGPLVSNNGLPIARVADRMHCDALGEALVVLMDVSASRPGFRFDYACFEDRGV